MFRKFLEAFFKHKLLLLLPPILVPAIVAALVVSTTPPAYEAAVGVWVDQPAYLTSTQGNGGPFGVAVMTQAARLTELLHTRAFVADVAQRTSLAPLLNSTAGQTRAAALIASGVTIGGAPTAGTAQNFPTEHLLVIRAQAPTAQLAYELCKAVVEAYQEKTAADQADQAAIGVDFYQSRFQDSQQQLSKATLDLRRYAATRLGDGSETDPAQTGFTAAMLDPKLSALQSNLQAAQLDYNNAQAALNQAQQAAVASVQGLQYGFQILDAPEVPLAPTNQLKKIIIYPIAAFVAGLGLTALVLVILVASDRSVRSELDLAPGLRSLGSVPFLELKKVPKKLRSGATRRAIGATAGMALPAPGAR